MTAADNARADEQRSEYTVQETAAYFARKVQRVSDRIRSADYQRSVSDIVGLDSIQGFLDRVARDDLDMFAAGLTETTTAAVRAECGCDLSVGPNAVHIVDGHDGAAARAVPSDPMANVLDDCRYCQGTGMATLNPDEESGSHICVPSDRTATTEDAVESLAVELFERSHEPSFSDDERGMTEAREWARRIAAELRGGGGDR